MSKGIGEKLLGLFIEEEVDETATVAQEVREHAAPDPKPSAPPPPVRPAVVAPGATHDASSFAAVYRRAGLPDADRDRLGKVIGLVESLPSEATGDVKRAIVAASLQAFGVPIDGVVSAGNAAVAALDAYVIEGERRSKEVLEEAEARIARLAAEIEGVRRLMAMQVDAQQELTRASMVERARVRAAIDFFDSSGAQSRDGVTPSAARLRRVL